MRYSLRSAAGIYSVVSNAPLGDVALMQRRVDVVETTLSQLFPNCKDENKNLNVCFLSFLMFLINGDFLKDLGKIRRYHTLLDPTSSDEHPSTLEELKFGLDLHLKVKDYFDSAHCWRGNTFNEENVKRILSGQWLNDEIMDGYVQLIIEHYSKLPRYPSMMALSSLPLTKHVVDSKRCAELRVSFGQDSTEQLMATGATTSGGITAHACSSERPLDSYRYRLYR